MILEVQNKAAYAYTGGKPFDAGHHLAVIPAHGHGNLKFASYVVYLSVEERLVYFPGSVAIVQYVLPRPRSGQVNNILDDSLTADRANHSFVRQAPIECGKFEIFRPGDL